MWYAGIDWADDHHDVVVIDEQGQRVAACRVLHTPEGLAQLVTFLQRTVVSAPTPQELACLIETTHGLLITALLDAGLAVYPVNPKTVDRRRKPSGAKTDAIDAYLLAKTGRSDLADLRRLASDSPLVQELKALTRDQDGLIQSQTRLVNQLIACLKAYYPVALDLFTKLQQPLTLAFLQAYPTLEAAQHASVDQVTELLRQHHHPTPGPTAQALWERLHQPQLQADAITTRTKSRLLLALVSQLAPLLEQIKQYDTEISRLFLRHPDSAIFASLPRAGKRLAPRLLAGWGDDRERYGSAANVQALAGTSPVAYQSGNYAKAHRRYACVKPFRNVLYQFAWQSTFQEAWAAAYYRRKRSEGKSHSMAVRALANVWVRIIHALWRQQRPYRADIFVVAQQAHGGHAA
jgi:transposase